MTLSPARVRHYLRSFDFQKLFTQELGWDRPAAPVSVTVDGHPVTLRPVAEKRGVQVLECAPDSGGAIPDYARRRKIETAVAKLAFEHLIVFVDAAKTTQVWQWVARRPGSPAAYREHTWHVGQTGDALVQKFDRIAIPLSDEEALDLTGAVTRLRDAFDRDKVTKKFFQQFEKEHAAFLKFVKGITDAGDRAWYASLMLNRLMFVYFIQKKGFLDGNTDYLRDRLDKVRARKGKGKFHSFYRAFLLTLFHEGFGKQKAIRTLDSELAALLGDVPYLNGGLFDVHDLETRNDAIDIPDEAFEKLFAFFDRYEWHLDSRPLAKGNEINPDVLGYIFEKYINQKQMGAYYTKEDITDYISKNTIIPHLFDAAKFECEIAFTPTSPLWKLLRDNPDRYLYPAVRKGVLDPHGEVIPLPPEIAAGVLDVSKRGGWNKPAAADFALPTETWREHVARRTRCLEVREKLLAGHVHAINDLITFNLDIRQFAADAVAACEGPELLRAFYKSVTTVTVLDPTCGSGAFLFAALNILQPMYDACLDRMAAFVDDADRSGDVNAKGRYEDFRDIMADAARHGSRDYFVLKSIIVRNLFGVDIMAEAVEICKLRLFLKLVAQVDQVKQLEPLPDIDFNIRPGNTLVGFATKADVQKAFGGKLDFAGETGAIEVAAGELARRFRLFRDYQTSLQDGQLTLSYTKADLRAARDELRAKLDSTLAGVYGIDSEKVKPFAAWRESHQPFHWFVEFYEIMAHGGFDVVIGNPPYVEYSKVRRDYQLRGYQTETCGNLYAMCMERSYEILAMRGQFGFIVQSPLVSTQRMASVRRLLVDHSSTLHVSTYDDRPSKLFDGMHHCRLAIVLAQKSINTATSHRFSTRYYKWYSEERNSLFATVGYTSFLPDSSTGIIPKFRSDTERSIYDKVIACQDSMGGMFGAQDDLHRVYYKITGVGHWFSFTTTPPKFWRDGVEGNSTRENSVTFATKRLRNTAFCCLSSTLHYWLYQIRTNCRDFNPSDLSYLPLPHSVVTGLAEFDTVATRIMKQLEETSVIGEGNYEVGGKVQFQKFRPRAVKPLLDDIDRVLAKHYGFTSEELDFILNYDIKYRMGADAGEDDDGA